MRRRPAGEVGVGACVGRAAVGPLAVLLHNTRGRVGVLEAMALLVPKRRVGLVVQGPDRWNVYDPRIIRWRLAGAGRSDQFRSLTQRCRAVEPVAASLAARNASAAQRTRIAELAVDLRRLGEAGALVDFLAADIEFHNLNLEASGNDMFCALREVITEVLSGRSHQGLMPRMPRPHALDTHEQVAHAIRDGHATTAEAGMASLLAEVSSAIRQAGGAQLVSGLYRAIRRRDSSMAAPAGRSRSRSDRSSCARPAPDPASTSRTIGARGRRRTLACWGYQTSAR